MNRAAVLAVAGLEDAAVRMQAAVGRQQRRVDVEQPSLPGADEAADEG